MSHSTASLPAATALRTDSPAAFMRILVIGSTAAPRPPRAPPRAPPVLRGAFGSPEAARVEVVADAAGLPLIATSGGRSSGMYKIRRQLGQKISSSRLCSLLYTSTTRSIMHAVQTYSSRRRSGLAIVLIASP